MGSSIYAEGHGLFRSDVKLLRGSQALAADIESNTPPTPGRMCQIKKCKESSIGQHKRPRANAKEKVAIPISAPADSGASGAPRRTAQNKPIHGTTATVPVKIVHWIPARMN